jgi:hypothetical protein
MRFIEQGRRIYRELNEPLKINLDIVLIDVQPSEIDKMSQTMALLELILSGPFEIIPSPVESEQRDDA